MEGLIGLALLLAFALVVVGPILAILAFVRVRSLASLLPRLGALEREVSGLRRRLDEVGLPSGPSPPAERPRREPAVEPPRPAGRETPGPAPRREDRPAAPPPPPPRRPREAGASAAPPPPPAAPIDWERWIGIRGAAVAGAVVLALAGLLFFKYSVERGLITPTMRVVLGTATGLACLIGAQWLRARDYRFTAEGISGAGVVILYAAFWAAHVLFGLVGFGVAFVLMILVTVACCLLAVRQASLLVAVLGLVGGFATPLLLATGADRPIGLFGYVLLLDLGLLTVGRKRRWPSLGVLSLLGTVVLQALWIGLRMGPGQLFLGLIILGVFAVLFVAAGRLAPERQERAWLWSQAGAILFPFAFALYFAARVDLGHRLWPIAVLLALLGGAAGWLARERSLPAFGTGAATACVAVVGVWLLRNPPSLASAWELACVAAGLALLFHLFVEGDRVSSGLDGPAPAAAMAAGGMFMLLLFGAVSAANVPPWPWLAGWVAIAAMFYRHAGFPGRGALQVAAAVGLGVGLSSTHLFHHGAAAYPPPPAVLALLVAASVALVFVAGMRGEAEVRRFAGHAAAALPVLLLLGLAFSRLGPSLGPWPALGAALLLGILALAAATRCSSGAWFAAATAATVAVHTGWAWGRPVERLATEGVGALAVTAAAVIVFTAWPFVAAHPFSTDRLAWYAAALAGPVWFPSIRRLFESAFGDGFIGLLPVTLGALSLGATTRALRSLPAQAPIRRSAVVWFSAVAIGFVSLAIPLQLQKEWITVGWALEGLAVIVLWKRLDHPGLKYFGLFLLGAASARLVVNPALLGYYPRSGIRIVNWLSYTYLVPAAALLGSAASLAPLEFRRARRWETTLYDRGYPLGAIAAAMAAIVVVFVWINLTIADWFATGATLTLSFGSTPSQRLAVSIAWAVYALALLGFGMSRDSLGLRWVSLGFLLITIGKVFLYDLGALRDLYRVASLVGLAVSLILVSLLYQRFVFRKREKEEATP